MPALLNLPQNANDPSSRAAHLEKMRQRYAFSLTYGGQIATINKLPPNEKSGLYYQMKGLAHVSGLLPSIPGFIWKSLKHGLLGIPFKNPDSYNFFGLSTTGSDKFRKNYANDAYFAFQCVAGANPVLIEGVDEQNPLPSTFKINKANLPLAETDLQSALSENRLYMLNFHMLENIKQHLGEVGGHHKHTASPIALFYLEDDGHLRPLAIQLDVNRKTSAENPVITPNNNTQWLFAKTCVMSADAVVHELWTHAVQIHYLMESIILATYRQLSMRHPLLALLDPHLQQTLAVNVNPLYEPTAEGKIPFYGKMFPADNQALVKFMAEGMRNYKFRERAFNKDIKNRHMENPKLIYPYRDQGKPIWDAIEKFVNEYIGLYYEHNDDVVADFELQAWALELGGSKDSGSIGISDFPTAFATVEEVAEIFTQIIFTATAHHSAVHYPQSTYAAFVPNMPNSLYDSTESIPNEESATEELMRYLPPFGMAAFQSFIYYAVNFKVNRMGEYPLSLFDAPAAAVIRKYQEELKQISREYARKSGRSEFHYPYLDPKNIPNSVTV